MVSNEKKQPIPSGGFAIDEPGHAVRQQLGLLLKSAFFSRA